MTDSSIVILSAGFVAAICTLLTIVLLRAVGKVGKMVSDVQEGQSQMLRTVTLRHKLLECEVRASAWQVLYLFTPITPESPDHDYSDYVIERLDDALGNYEGLGKQLRELEDRWETSSDCLLERTNAFRLIRSIARRTPSGASGGSDKPTAAEGGACAVGQGPRHERAVGPDS